MDGPRSVSRLWAVALLVAGQAASLRSPLHARMHLDLSRRDIVNDQLPLAAAEFASIKTFNLSVPVDHFHNDSAYEPHSSETFPLRYYLDTSHYKPGGPVIVLASGESAIEERLPFLQYGIASILANATGGVGIVLEHRYYGTSFPSADLETQNLRFLSTDQALADTAYFARHVKFAGLENADLDLAPSNAPWIIYGGSYAGAFAAFARKLYPDVFWGAISSSGVTEAIEDYWQYYEAARLFAPGDCGPTTQRLTKVVDGVLFGDDAAAVEHLKGLFGLRELSDDYEFARAISFGITALQSTNWDPDRDVTNLGAYCASVTSKDLLFASVSHMRPVVERFVAQASLGEEEDFVTQMLNYIGFVRMTLRRLCGGVSIPKCLGPSPVDTRLSAAGFRSWTYQVCTQWGYFQTGSGTPESQLATVSRKISLEASREVCKQQFNITTPPDVAHINRLGGFNISYPRLAIIDGKQDPWRQATPHAIGLPPRESTTSEPFLLIDPGVHHWDENGVPEERKGEGLPPPHIAEVQQQMVEFVKAWVEEFHDDKDKQSLYL